VLFIETGGHESPRVETLNRCSTKRSIHKVSSSLALRTRKVCPSGEDFGDPLFVSDQIGGRDPRRQGEKKVSEPRWRRASDSAKGRKPGTKN
jgi:hypothetical protein